MKVFVIKQYGSRKVGDIVLDMPETVAEDLILKGFVSETEPIAETEEEKQAKLEAEQVKLDEIVILKEKLEFSEKEVLRLIGICEKQDTSIVELEAEIVELKKVQPLKKADKDGK